MRENNHQEHTYISEKVLNEMVENFAVLFNDDETADLICQVSCEDRKVKIHRSFVKISSPLLFEKITRENKVSEMEADILKLNTLWKIPFQIAKTVLLPIFLEPEQKQIYKCDQKYKKHQNLKKIL